MIRNSGMFKLYDQKYEFRELYVCKLNAVQNGPELPK